MTSTKFYITAGLPPNDAADDGSSKNYVTAGLPPEKKEIMDSLNKEEKDALSVAVYKRGPEAVKEKLDEQLDVMVDKKGKQKYIHVLEGYKAWEYWNREEE